MTSATPTPSPLQSHAPTSDAGRTLTRRLFLKSAAALAAPFIIQPAFAESSAAGPAGDKTYVDALGSPGHISFDDPMSLTRADLDDMRASGLTTINMTVGGVGSYAKDYDATVRDIAYWNEQIAAHPDYLLQVRSVADIAEARRSRRMGVIYGFQDMTSIGEDLTRLDLFEQLGVRIFQLTYNRRNLIGDGCLEPGNAGLSLFGNALVERLNQHKLLIDLSHCGDRTTREGIAASKTPVAITHTGCAALAPLPRNKSDAVLKLLADKGGVAGIYLMPFLRSEGQPTAADLVAHIEHAVNVCGEDHVGIGTDVMVSPMTIDDEFRKRFAEWVNQRRSLGIAAPGESPNIYNFVPDLNTADRFTRLAALLAKRGHSETRIEKILGVNFARLFDTVWSA